MLKVAPHKNVEGCIRYFLKGRELDPVEKRGTWMGQGAAILGLTPSSDENPSSLVSVPFTEKDLRSVLRGFAPASSPVTPHLPLNGRYVTAKQRRCAYDFVLSTHKSISVVALCLPGEHLAQAMAVRHAWARAVADCVAFMECLARRGNGIHKDVETGNLLIAAFTHLGSRRNDPHLHTHLLTANATYDASDAAHRMWYALEPLSLFRQAREIDMVFQRELTRHLRETGLRAEMQRAGSIRVASLPINPTVCRRLSQANNAIVAATAGRGPRTSRTRADYRLENILNERLRPRKSGLLAWRDEMFERALSPSEIKEIVARIGEPIPPENPPLNTPPASPPPKELDRLLLQASDRLRFPDTRPRHVSLTALAAAEAHRDVPFQPFYNHAHANLLKLRRKAVADRLAKDYAKAQDRFWHEQNWFGLKVSAPHFATPPQPTARPAPPAPAAAAPLTVPITPNPPDTAPEVHRATWVVTALAERKALQTKFACDHAANSIPLPAPTPTAPRPAIPRHDAPIPQAADPTPNPPVPQPAPLPTPDVHPYLLSPEEPPPSQTPSL